MSIELDPITSGYSTGKINENFQEVENELNNNVLRRDGLATGEANQMEVALDMNSNPILNATTDITDSGSLITVGEGDARYVNLTGDTMQGSLNMDTYPVFVRIAVNGNEPARKDELDSEISSRQSADSNLQAQISGTDPLEASAFSEISWHGQTIENSVTIPDNKNAWSFGPTMTIAAGQSVTVGTNSFWTIANGEVTA